MSGHTPGPWVYREITPYNDGIGYISADGHDIVHAGVADLPAEVNRSNGLLQAAAPELLEACERAEWWLTTIEGSEAIRSVLRAAISKAEGK